MVGYGYGVGGIGGMWYGCGGMGVWGHCHRGGGGGVLIPLWGDPWGSLPPISMIEQEGLFLGGGLGAGGGLWGWAELWDGVWGGRSAKPAAPRMRRTHPQPRTAAGTTPGPLCPIASP